MEVVMLPICLHFYPKKLGFNSPKFSATFPGQGYDLPLGNTRENFRFGTTTNKICNWTGYGFNSNASLLASSHATILKIIPKNTLGTKQEHM